MLKGVLRALLPGRIISALGLVAAFSTMVMMVIVVADVSRRTLTGHSIAGVFEISEYLMVAIVFLALAYTQRVGGHVKVNFLISRFRGKSRTAVGVLTLALSLGISTVMTLFTAKAAIYSVQTGEFLWGLISLPLWPARILLPVGFLFLCIQLVIQIVREIQGHPSEV